MSARTNRTIALRAFEAINEALASGDLSLIDDFITPDFIQHDSQSPTPATRDDLKRYVRELRAAFPDLRITIADIVAEGDRVAGRISARGTHLGEWAGMAPTGEPVSWTGLQMIRIAGGMVTEFWGQPLASDIEIPALGTSPPGPLSREERW
jgi:predicted ester cyclase